MAGKEVVVMVAEAEAAVRVEVATVVGWAVQGLEAVMVADQVAAGLVAVSAAAGSVVGAAAAGSVAAMVAVGYS